VLEDMPEVVCYVKNQGLGFTIPYTLDGEEKGYLPDFLVRIKAPHLPSQRSGEGSLQGKACTRSETESGNGGLGLSDDTLNLILEVSGEARKDKAAKTATARTLWVPAVNNHGGLGRWAFVEISDPWDAANTIRASLRMAGVTM
jgi:type III restriction enzyme